MKEFKESFNALVDALPEGYTFANLSWDKEGVNYTIGLSTTGGSTSATFTAYKPTPPANPPATS